MELQEVIDLGFKIELDLFGVPSGKANFSVYLQNEQTSIIIQYWNLTKRFTLIIDEKRDGEEGKYVQIPLNYIDNAENLKLFIYLLTAVKI